MFDQPVFVAVQLAPLFVEREMSPPSVAAKRLAPLTAKHSTKRFVKPAALQLVPLSVEWKTPTPVAAKRPVPVTARARQGASVRLVAVQFVPLLVDRKTPLPIPARTTVSLTTRENTAGPGKPALALVQLVPLSVDR